MTTDNADLEINPKGVRISFTDNDSFQSDIVNLLDRLVVRGWAGSKPMTKLQKRIVAQAVTEQAVAAIAKCSRPAIDGRCSAFEKAITLEAARTTLQSLGNSE